MRYPWIVPIVTLALLSCSKTSPTAPSQNTSTTPAQTRIIGLSGDLSFGSVPAATMAQREYRITNSGTDTLTVSSISVPSGFVSTLKSGTLYPNETKTVHVVFAPESARNYAGALVVSSNATSGSSTLGLSGAGTVAGGLVAQTFTGDLSGGDARCTSGLQPYTFDVGPCKTFDFTTTTSGRVDALLTYNGDDALLSLDIYNPATGDSIVRGDLQFDPYPGNGEHGVLNANISTPGRYQFRVRVLSSSKITSFTIITTRPN